VPHVKLTRQLKSFFPGLDDGHFPGATVSETIAVLDEAFPGFANHILDERGMVRPHVNIYIGQSPLQDSHKLNEPLQEDASLLIFQAVSGG